MNRHQNNTLFVPRNQATYSSWQSNHTPEFAMDSIKSWYPSGTAVSERTQAANAGISAFTSRNLASVSSRWKSEILFTNG